MEVPEAWGTRGAARPFQPAAFDCAVAIDPKENLYVANGGPAEPGVQYGGGTARGASTSNGNSTVEDSGEHAMLALESRPV